MAQFKVADCLFEGSEHASAISNYWAAINITTNTVGRDDRLVDRALYQIVRSGVVRLDLPSAGQAVSNLLEWFPNSYYSDRSMLLYGQSLNRQGKPSEAREVLAYSPRPSRNRRCSRRRAWPLRERTSWTVAGFHPFLSTTGG